MVSWLETHALGNGVAGTTAATAFRERDKDSQNDRQVKSVFLVPHRAPHFVWFVRPGKWELTEVCEEGLVDRTNLLFNRYGFVAGQVRREKPTRRFVVATHTRRHILEANASLCGRDLPCFFSLNNLRSRILFYSFVQEQAMKATVEQTIKLEPAKVEFLERMAKTYGLADTGKAIRCLINYARENPDQHESIFSEVRCLDC
ncbi:MAG: hypothetical protein DMG06_01775 [Acidobacteria bacterium]|nr:MAG: hypothetical protein DMG06_01775 [Acidobacteriota bacterium]